MPVQVQQSVPAAQLQPGAAADGLIPPLVEQLVQIGHIAAQIPRPLLGRQGAAQQLDAVFSGKTLEPLLGPLLCQPDSLAVILEHHHHARPFKQAGHGGVQVFDPVGLVRHHQIPSPRNLLQIDRRNPGAPFNHLGQGTAPGQGKDAPAVVPAGGAVLQAVGIQDVHAHHSLPRAGRP